MTGSYPKRALPIPHVLFPGYDHGLNPDEITVAELLKELGYRTACIGKWHLGDQPELLPTRQGFDYFFGLRHLGIHPISEALAAGSADRWNFTDPASRRLRHGL